MGFLSESAKKAYKKGSRRAHIPEWFEPASYVLGVIIGVFLIVSYVLDDGPAPRGPVTAPEELVLSGSGTATPGETTPEDGTYPTGTPSTGAATGDTGNETIELVDGGTITLPGGAWKTAQATSFALLTGNFEKLSIYPGKVPPILLTVWKEPSILGLVDAERNGDGTLAFTVRIDPDGTGSEKPRDIPFLLAEVDNVWTYLPG